MTTSVRFSDKRAARFSTSGVNFGSYNTNNDLANFSTVALRLTSKVNLSENGVLSDLLLSSASGGSAEISSFASPSEIPSSVVNSTTGKTSETK